MHGHPQHSCMHVLHVPSWRRNYTYRLFCISFCIPWPVFVHFVPRFGKLLHVFQNWYYVTRLPLNIFLLRLWFFVHASAVVLVCQILFHLVWIVIILGRDGGSVSHSHRLTPQPAPCEFGHHLHHLQRSNRVRITLLWILLHPMKLWAEWCRTNAQFLPLNVYYNSTMQSREHARYWNVRINTTNCIAIGPKHNHSWNVK